MRYFWVLAGLTLAALLTGCSSAQFYASGQNWQRNACSKLLDSQARERCLKGTEASYDTYKQQAERLKP